MVIVLIRLGVSWLGEQSPRQTKLQAPVAKIKTSVCVDLRVLLSNSIQGLSLVLD